MEKNKRSRCFSCLLSLSFFLSSPVNVTAQQKHSNISIGSSLNPKTNSSWLSPSGLYAFGFYPQGNGSSVGIFISGIPQKTVIWTANRDDPPVPKEATLSFGSNGRIVLQSPQGDDKYIGSESTASSASMLDSGNFVIYNSGQEILWQSFENPTDTIVMGQPLLAGQQLVSSVSEDDHSSGIFYLEMQHDGNLVQYPVKETRTDWDAYYSTGTFGKGENVTLNLDDDGHLYLLNSTGFNIMNLFEEVSPKENRTIYLLRIDPDGIFRLYSRDLEQNGNQSLLWSSSYDKCNPKGLCGLNGYCVNYDDVVDCRCLPGFDFVDQNKRSSGCVRNFTADSCKKHEENIKFTMEAVANTIWEDNSYSFVSLSTEKDCENECMEDCNCGAATFKDRECRKQSLPLRFGRRSLSDSNQVLVKVAKFTEIGAEPREIKKKTGNNILNIAAVTGAIALAILATLGVLIYRNRIGAYKRISENGNVKWSEVVAPRSFSYAELEKASAGFKEEVGRGTSATVYKGITSNGRVVAIKRLENVLAQGEREFETEVKVIGVTHHRNLVKFLGYCYDGPNRLLVYEYMSNGSLADVLFTDKKPPSWNERVGIALDVARGILYLHEECDTQIIHCDLKPQNILMDEHGNTKISDFGLSKLMKPGQSKTYTGIRGTRGYIAPEWHRKLPVTVKADVYSFGIVLLEIICCRRSVDASLSEEEAILEQWVCDCYESDQLGNLVNGEDVDKKKMARMIKVALWCIQDEPSLRPSMKKVLLMLEGTVDIPSPPSPTSFLSSI